MLYQFIKIYDVPLSLCQIEAILTLNIVDLFCQLTHMLVRFEMAYIMKKSSPQYELNLGRWLRGRKK